MTKCQIATFYFTNSGNNHIDEKDMSCGQTERNYRGERKAYVENENLFASGQDKAINLHFHTGSRA